MVSTEEMLAVIIIVTYAPQLDPLISSDKCLAEEIGQLVPRTNLVHAVPFCPFSFICTSIVYLTH